MKLSISNARIIYGYLGHGRWDGFFTGGKQVVVHLNPGELPGLHTASIRFTDRVRTSLPMPIRAAKIWAAKTIRRHIRDVWIAAHTEIVKRPHTLYDATGAALLTGEYDTIIPIAMGMPGCIAREVRG